MPTDRETAAKALAEAMGWTYHENHFQWRRPYFVTGDGGMIFIPADAAPLRERLEFVGRLAEAVGVDQPSLAWDDEGKPIVSFTFDGYGINRSLPLAAMLAATEVVKARRAK